MNKWYFFFCVFIIFSCSSNRIQFSSDALLISNVQIIDVQNGKVIENQNVVIDSGLIIMITTEKIDPGSFSKSIDGSGKFLMPGLAEIHAHIPPPSTSMERIEETLFLYLSNGVTTIRGMLGDSLHLTLREQSESGVILSPRIFTSSPSLNGNTVQNKEEAITKVTKYKNDGYDFLKIHPGIQREVFDQIVSTANEVGIPFAGHVPVDVGIRHALESNYASIDHIDGFLEGLVPENMEVDPTANGFFGYDFVPMADTTLIDELVALAKEHEVWIVPTQSLFERWFSPVPAKELAEQPEMQYMPGSTMRTWLRAKSQVLDSETFNEKQWEDFDRIRRSLIQKLTNQGHGILMGSDAPQIFNVPGFSIHHEIDGMQHGGMTNLQVIQAGTMNPALFFGKEQEFGQVKEGMVADLLIVTENPLEDLDALQNLEGVMRKGRWITKEEIQLKLDLIAEHAKGQ